MTATSEVILVGRPMACRKLSGRFVRLDGNDCASKPVPHFYKVPLTGRAFCGYTPHIRRGRRFFAREIMI